jgi:LuxR family maltose regulon positive regulatory protein
VISRPRVERLMGAAWRRKVTLVLADAGYGKTTALEDLADLGAARWVRLRPTDRDVAVFASRIAAAAGVHDRDSAAAVVGPDDKRGFADTLVAAACQHVDDGADEVLLVIDEVEHVQSEAVVVTALQALLLQAPPRLHIVLSGRQLPVLGLGTALGRGEVLRVGARDLAFTPEETLELLQQRLGSESRVVAERCWALTRGWPAAVCLALGSLPRDAPDEQLESGWVGSWAASWREFADEVVGGLPPRLRLLLEVAAVTGMAEPSLFDALGMSMEPVDLTDLASRGLLVADNVTRAVRLSPVLEESVRSRVDPRDVAAWRVAAGDWLEGQGRLAEALERHADGSVEGLREFLLRQGHGLVLAGAAQRVAELLRASGSFGERALDAVLADTLLASGDWDGAVEVFTRVAALHAGLHGAGGGGAAGGARRRSDRS